MKRSLLIFACLTSLLVVVPHQAFSADAGSATKVETKVVAKVAPASQPAVAAPVAAPAPKAAETPAPQLEAKWWQVLLKHLLELIFAVLGILVTGFVTVLLKKYGFEAQAGKVNDILERARGYAEQLSIKKLKLDGKPVPSAEKMELAIQFAQKLAEEYKVQAKGKEWWEGKLESWMGMKKNGTTSA